MLWDKSSSPAVPCSSRAFSNDASILLAGRAVKSGLGGEVHGDAALAIGGFVPVQTGKPRRGTCDVVRRLRCLVNR
jgi:hypothetical protein